MSSISRVTQRTVSDAMLAGLQTNLSALQRIQEKLASGKEINQPSDSPVGTVQAMRYRSESARADQWSRNAQDGISWLGTVDTTLTSMTDSINRVRTLAVAGQSGTASYDARSAMADEVDQLKQGLLSQANTTYLGRPVFGGTTTSATAYDQYGSYQGDKGVVTRAVGDGQQVQINVNGPDVFGSSDSANLFATVQKVADDLRSNPSGLSADMAQLDQLTTTLRGVQSTVGARYNRLQSMQSAAQNQKLNLQDSLAQVESVDLPKTITELSMQQVAYQAALAATAKAVQPSLADFLK